MRNEVSAYLENIALFLLGITLLAFPIVFTTLTTEVFLLPKQLLIAVAALAALLLFGAKAISDRRVSFRRTPFDLPLFLFTVVAVISAFLSVNFFDALIAVIPFVFAAILFFAITNFSKQQSSFFFLLSSLTVGAVVLAVLALLSVLKIYVLPFDFAKAPAFTTVGSLLDQAMYLAFILPATCYLASPLANGTKKVNTKDIAFAVASVIILGGLGASLYKLFTLTPASGGFVLLPFQTGFQTAFAAISQDAGRLWQGFFFGSGFGTYLSDFTRFKPAAFNADPSLWSFTFFRSSSLLLELLATVGVLGVAAFLFLCIRLVQDGIKHGKHNPFFISLMLGCIAVFVLPFSFVTQTLFVALIALYAAIQGSHYASKYFDIDLDFVALRRGMFAASTPDDPTTQSTGERKITRILPAIVFIFLVIVVAVLGYNTTMFVLSDAAFQRSLVAASANNGLQTYNEQTNAIRMFPNRDAFHRVYSQTNLALANSLAASTQQGSSPSAQTQQTVLTLIQQSINAARNATALSPLTTANWQNLSSTYRSLIGFGENAENFAVLANQQAIALDPNNPQGYINLGSIYYQLRQWDDAQRQFQIAISLKNDLANAYYNLGHTLEQKGDNQAALEQYKTVKTLVATDAESVKQINAEIEALEKKLGAASQQTEDTTPVAETGPQGQTPLGITQPQTQLPERNPQVAIPAPSGAPVASPTPTVTPTP